MDIDTPGPPRGGAAASAIPLLQVVHALYPQARDGAALYAWEVARALGGAVLSLTPRPEAAPPEPLWSGIQVLTPHPAEGALAAWHRALDAVQPRAVLVQHLGAASPALLLDARERGLPYAVFLHDYTPQCPTRHLWHRRQEACSGPGRTGWKCAWCVSGTARRAAELPLRALMYRHRPQAWRTALLRADVLVAPSRFARDYWVALGAPPERCVLIPPRWLAPLAPAPPGAAPLAPAPRTALRLLFANPWGGGWDLAGGGELLAAALDQVRPGVQLEVAGHLDPAEEMLFRDAIASRHSLLFHGAVPHDAMPALIAACDAVVIPSRWEQLDSRLAAEARCLGTRVVATAVGGHAEAIIHGVNGFLAAADDPGALAEALQEAWESARAPEAASNPAWTGERMRAQADAEAAQARTQLERLLELLLRQPPEPELGLALEESDWLAASAPAFGLSARAAADKLVAALRGADSGTDTDGDAGDNGTDAAFAARALAGTRGRRVALNHAIAFFRACGCRRIAFLPSMPDPGTEPGTPAISDPEITPGIARAADATGWFQAWGLETVAATALPDGIFVQPAAPANTPPEALYDTAWVRRRFPQAHAMVALSADGTTAETWLLD